MTLWIYNERDLLFFVLWKHKLFSGDYYATVCIDSPFVLKYDVSTAMHVIDRRLVDFPPEYERIGRQRAVVPNLGMLNERTYIGILPGQQRQSATDLCVDELSGTYTSGLLPLCRLMVSVPYLPRAWKLRPELDEFRNSWTCRVAARSSTSPLNFKTSSPVAVVIVRAVLLQESAAFRVIVANLLTELYGWYCCFGKCHCVKKKFPLVF